MFYSIINTRSFTGKHCQWHEVDGIAGANLECFAHGLGQMHSAPSKFYVGLYCSKLGVRKEPSKR